MAFVDYESWYISLLKNFGLKPDIKAWFEDLSTRVYLTEAVFFADFSHKSLAGRNPADSSIFQQDHRHASPNGVEKDYTDFIILDNIYQKALASQDIEAFILFSGDGHFSSATSFLKNFYSKEVGIYGIQGSFSRQLQDTASWCVTLPTEEALYGLQYRQIFTALKRSKQIATRKSVIEAVCKAGKNVRKSDVDASVKRLICRRIHHRAPARAQGGQPTDCLFVDWDKVAQSPYGEE